MMYKSTITALAALAAITNGAPTSACDESPSVNLNVEGVDQFIPLSVTPDNAFYEAPSLGEAANGRVQFDYSKVGTATVDPVTGLPNPLTGEDNFVKVDGSYLPFQQGGPLRVEVQNRMNEPLSISFAYTCNGITCSPSVLGAPTDGTFNETIVMYIPRGSSGRAAVGRNPDQLAEGTKFEWTMDGTGIYFDLSLVDGYTVPMVAQAFKSLCLGGTTTTNIIAGSNAPLYALASRQGMSCPMEGESICKNPMRPFNDGPAHPFFAPSTPGSYTFPNDHNTVGCPNVGGTLIICVGSTCPPATRQQRISMTGAEIMQAMQSQQITRPEQLV